ncbi:MAG: hypothetical protein NWE92_13605 [Candidatus Bathyarchaeota archaeon]|nr:hypothetical protein [Candidatus Bathyarchaeota archaeon]
MAEQAMFKILRVLRKLPINLLGVGNQKVIFSEYFKGFHKVKAVQAIFGEKTDEVLSHLTVELSWVMGYMYVDGDDGHLVVSKGYLNNGDRTFIYLDLIHELCHVKQFMEGRELFDPRYEYVDRPTEIEAYRYTVKEARRLGLSDERIRTYLWTEWMDEDGFRRLAKSVDVPLA